MRESKWDDGEGKASNRDGLIFDRHREVGKGKEKGEQVGTTWTEKAEKIGGNWPMQRDKKIVKHRDSWILIYGSLVLLKHLITLRKTAELYNFQL